MTIPSPNGAKASQEKALSQALHNILYSTALTMRIGRLVLAGVLVFLGLQRLYITSAFLDPQLVYEKVFIKDLVSNYVVSAAVIDGVNPYQSVDLLAEKVIGENKFFPHPLAHPPPGVLFTSWLAYLDLGTALLVWFILQLSCTVLISYFVIRLSGYSPGIFSVGFITLVLIGWYPFTEDLIEGNLSIILLLPLLAGWWLLRNRRESWAGILFGFTIALKIVLWPLAVYFLLKRRWRVLVPLGVTIGVLNFMAGAVLGFETLINYYTNVSAQVAPLYKAATFNLSLWTIGWRVFSGTGSYLTGTDALPLVNLPLAGQIISFGLPALLFLYVFWRLWFSRDLDLAFAALMSLSLLISPITWTHYYVMAVIPILVISQRLSALFYPLKSSIVFAIVTIAVYIPTVFLGQIASSFSPGRGQPVSFFAGSILMLPTIALLGMTLLIFQSSPKLLNDKDQTS